MFLQARFAQLQHGGRGFDFLEQRIGRLVDANVSRLRGQHNSDEQLVGVAVFQLALRLRRLAREARKKFFDLGGFHALVLEGDGAAIKCG